MGTEIISKQSGCYRSKGRVLLYGVVGGGEGAWVPGGTGVGRGSRDRLFVCTANYVGGGSAATGGGPHFLAGQEARLPQARVRWLVLLLLQLLGRVCSAGL